MQIRIPPLAELASRWPEIEPLLRKATARTGGRYEPIHVLQMAMAGRAGFWLIEDDGALIAVAVGEVRQWPTGLKDLDIPFVAGRRLGEWWPLFVEETEARARALDCAAVTSACGRRGWARFWRAHGVKVHVAGETVIRDL